MDMGDGGSLLQADKERKSRAGAGFFPGPAEALPAGNQSAQ